MCAVCIFHHHPSVSEVCMYENKASCHKRGAGFIIWETFQDKNRVGWTDGSVQVMRCSYESLLFSCCYS